MKLKYLALAVGLTMGTLFLPSTTSEAVSCPELKIIFARGSGETRWQNQNYLALKSALEGKLQQMNIQYEFEDLDYPAVGVNNALTFLGAFFGGGEAYEFGKSVNDGAEKLIKEVNTRCTNTKYVVAGYSQGAMTTTKAVRELNADKVIYVTTFGDPKIYLPEGFGLIPTACSGMGLSDYRMYVPDCRAYIGKLGAYLPYEPENFKGKMGTWCNKKDIFCSSYLSVDDHVAYAADNLYEDAARVIAEKVAAAFGVENTYVTPHDTAILIDSTRSMDTLIDQYKAEALNLARKTLETGGRVALYDYRDYQEGYEPVKHCDFETCTLEKIQEELEKIEVDGGGDVPESLLASAFTVMQELNWKLGATKSLVVLTDAGYHNPDYDLRQTTFLDVKKLSKQIDPVNIYIVSDGYYLYIDEQNELARATGGRVVTSVDELHELTDYIMARYDVLPRVTESEVWEDTEELPTAEILAVVDNDNAVTVNFRSSNGRAMIALNEAFLGVAEGSKFTITELDRSIENVVTVVPISETRSGVPVSTVINAVATSDAAGNDAGETSLVAERSLISEIPLAPNTGKL